MTSATLPRKALRRTGPAGGLFAVTGSGAGIDGSADAFHFVSRRIVERGSHAVEVTARVASVGGFRPLPAALMVRGQGGASAPHVSVFVPPAAFSRALGLTFVRRRSDGGAATATLGPAVAHPAWIRLVVDNNDVRAFYREASNAPWRFLGRTRAALGRRFEIGLAVSSFEDGTFARATFDNVAVRHVRR